MIQKRCGKITKSRIVYQHDLIASNFRLSCCHLVVTKLNNEKKNKALKIKKKHIMRPKALESNLIQTAIRLHIFASSEFISNLSRWNDSTI